MKHSSKIFVICLLSVLLVLVASCSQPTPETIVETVVETVVVETEKEVTVVETVEVEKEVEVIKTVEVEKEVIKEVQPIIYNSYRSDPEVRRVDEMLVEMFNAQGADSGYQRLVGRARLE
jgi:hypothetical protein